jgi:hypothetical protein
MNKIYKCIITSVSFVLLFTSISSYANVVTFDDANSNSVVNTVVSSFSDGGLTFTSHGSDMGVWDNTTPNSNGTNSLIFSGFNVGDYISITRTGGGLFSLNSIDATLSWYDSNRSEVITVNGSPITLIQGMQTFSLGLNNVTQVDITGVPSNVGYWAMDNVNVTAVPEPSTYAFFLAGLGFIGLVACRRKNDSLNMSMTA